MKKTLLIALYIAFWGTLILFALIIIGALSQVSDSENEISYFIKVMFSVVIIPAAFAFYTFYTFLFNRYLQKQQLHKAIALGLSLAFISALLGNLSLYLLLDFNIECHKTSNFVAIPIMTFIGIIFGSIALVFKGFITWYKEIKLKEELLEKNHKTEMALVKSQLDPHFLFNTINNIDVLILKDPNEASSYLNKLSDIMRFMLFETKAGKIPLNNELLYIEKYIELQKIRTSNSNYVNYKIDGNPEGKHIAPMVFIPFIENAFKHTDNKKLENAINIHIQVQEDSTILDCTNKFSNLRKQKVDSNGLGNELIQKRLHLIYPDSHSLETIQEDNQYHVTLSIPNEEV